MIIRSVGRSDRSRLHSGREAVRHSDFVRSSQVRKVSQLSAIVAAVTGILILALHLLLEREAIRELELFDSFRRSATSDVTVLVAKLRNDKEGRYTEDLLQWLKQRQYPHFELGRRWAEDKGANEAEEDREEALNRSQSLALVEGYVGANGALLRLWAKGRRTSEEQNFGPNQSESKALQAALEKVMVQGMQYEAWLHGPRIGNDEEYERLRERARQTRKFLTEEKYLNSADFIIAYIENIRADKEGEEGPQQAAVGIYERLLAGTEEETERLALLVNLGIARFRVAKQERSIEVAEVAMRMWQEAEQLAAKIGMLDEWATARMFQSEAELLIYDIGDNAELLSSAVKRQMETSIDTQGALSLGTMESVIIWLDRADEARFEFAQRQGCVHGIENKREMGDARSIGECSGFEEIRWTEQEYRDREARTERWLGIARAAGDEATVAHLTGVRADLLRDRGLRENDPGVLITSFEATHEFRTRAGIIDKEIPQGELIIGIPQVVALVEHAAWLALACADLDYMKRLQKEVEVAELWCRRGDEQHCAARQAWRQDVVEALEYGIESWEIPNSAKADQTELQENRMERIWKHAAWVREKGANLAQSESLCPNRPQGITEREEQRENDRINERTLAYQKIPRTKSCVLSPRLSTIAPSLPPEGGKVEVEEWRRSVRAWIEDSRTQFQRDVQTIKECEGEPW